MKTSMHRELEKLLGQDNVRTGARALSPYFREPVSGEQLVLVTPRDEHGLSDVANFSYENELPLFSVRSRYIDDISLARTDGILVDLVKMNRIKKIDKRNLMAFVYGGVTFEQLQKELDKENMRLLFPVAGRSPCVLRSYIDRDILMGSGGYRHPHLSLFHAVLSNGELWVSGSQQMTDEGHADFREDQGPQLSPFFGASEDIFGIPFYGLVYTYPNREERRLIAFGFDEIGPASELVYKASHAEWCFEAFAANARYLSVLLAGGDAGKVSEIKRRLKPWTVVFTLEHYRDLVDLWEGYIKSDARELGGRQLRGQAPLGIEGLLKKPWYVYDRDFLKGRSKHVFCYQYFKNVPETFEVIDAQAGQSGLKGDDLGKIVVPAYFGGAAYCEADIYYNPEDKNSSKAAEAAYLNSFEALLDHKAFVDKPVGPVAEMVYERTDPSYVEMIKLFKRSVDPRGTLNPGRLIKGV